MEGEVTAVYNHRRHSGLGTSGVGLAAANGVDSGANQNSSIDSETDEMIIDPEY
jgi:hypothetical protein